MRAVDASHRGQRRRRGGPVRTKGTRTDEASRTVLRDQEIPESITKDYDRILCEDIRLESFGQ
jgi:hypothetical protein